MSAPRIITQTTVVSMEAMEWAERAAACFAEVIDAAEYGLGIIVRLDRVAFYAQRRTETLLNASWRAMRLIGPPPGWPPLANGHGQSCWPCYRDDEPCTHDPATSEQPPPLPRRSTR